MWRDLLAFFDSLDATFAFLLALPFGVAAAAFLADWVRDRLNRRQPPTRRTL